MALPQSDASNFAPDHLGATSEKSLPVTPDLELSLFREIFVHSPEAMAITRLRDGMLVDANEAWLALTVFDRAGAIGRTTLELGFWPDQASRERVLLGLALDKYVRDVETYITLPDGSLRYFWLNGRRVDSAGESYFLAYIKDATEQRKASEALHASERALEETNAKLNQQLAMYDVIQSVGKVGHWIHYTGQNVVQVSAGYAEMTRIGEQRFVPVGEHVQSVLREDWLPVKEALKALDGRVVEYRFRCADGTVMWMRSRMHRQMTNGVHTADFGVVQEITGERQALQAVNEQLNFIQRITARAPGLVYEYEIWPDGRVQFHFVSDGVESMLGISAHALRTNARLLFDQIDPDDVQQLQALSDAASRTMSPWQCEFRARNTEAQARWFMAHAVPQAGADGSILWCGSMTDISSQKHAQAKLTESETRFRSLTELSSDWYWQQDKDFRFVHVDPHYQSSVALPPGGLTGLTRWEVGYLGVTEQQWEAHRATLQAHEVFHDFELQRMRPDGSFIWISVSGAPFYDSAGEFAGYRGTGRNISARKQAEADIERLAFYDPLTGLPNRRLLLDRLRHALEASARHSSHGALLFIDLDNFKELNDTLGHHQGDALLKQVAERLLACVRGIDSVARLGGDEFVVMLEDLGSSIDEAGAQAELVGKKILQSLNQEFFLGDQPQHSTPSIGITLFFERQHDLDEVLKRADLAMYQSKAAGRNTLRFFDPQMQAAANARVTMEAELRLGMQRNEFVLYYQPVVDHLSVTRGVEALIRWQHPERGMVSPAEFIPVAEQTGLILPLGLWVMEAACQQLERWSHQPQTQKLSIAVNVSARQFRHPDFAEQLLNLLRVTGANPYRLKLELTESMLLSDFEEVIARMTELRSIGVGFALDDFGTGYSSLSYLKQLPLDQLKIDQSFVRDVLTDPNDGAIAKTILNLAASLDLNVVAEGVETVGQRDFLLACGCRAFQGYLFGRPVPVDQLVL
jgi:diguanylate cyclase (GGDEF)-like protein/PAS domain S-box-containing protein